MQNLRYDKVKRHGVSSRFGRAHGRVMEGVQDHQAGLVFKEPALQLQSHPSFSLRAI